MLKKKKKTSNSIGSPTTHKSASNESFLSKQGAKTNCAPHPLPLPDSLHTPPPPTAPFPGRTFYEERRVGVTRLKMQQGFFKMKNPEIPTTLYIHVLYIMSVLQMSSS